MALANQPAANHPITAGRLAHHGHGEHEGEEAAKAGEDAGAVAEQLREADERADEQQAGGQVADREGAVDVAALRRRWRCGARRTGFGGARQAAGFLQLPGA